MFVLSKIYIENKTKIILDTTLSDEKHRNYHSGNFISLIIGENGVGKSFLLKSLVDIFIYLEKIDSYKRKPKYRYEKFYIEYYFNGNTYSVRRNSGSEIFYSKNGISVNYKDIELPNRVLAVSFMINDKFLFSKNEANDSYRYLGVRSSTNSTYTSSITRKISENLIKSVNSGFLNQIKEMLSLLKFDTYLEFVVSEANTQNTYVVDFENRNKLTRIDTSAFTKSTQVSVCFKKDGEKFTFDSCSSGEKHILFAFTGILSQIQNNSLILIDEPEISLHPEWQTQYISTLRKLFANYYNCLFIIASHSHYFVSDLRPESSSIVAFYKDEKLSKSELIGYNTYAWSAENIIYNVFGLRTTRNYYFECDLNALMDLMENYCGDEAERIEIQKLANKLKRYLFDAKDPLHQIIEDAEEIINERA